MKLFHYAFLALLLLSGCEDDVASPILSPEKIPFQEFTILPGQADTILVTGGGVRIHPDLQDDEFDLTKSVSVKVREFLTLEDMVLAGLSTHSDKGLLQSRGMVYVEASQEGRPINFSRPWSGEIPVSYLEDGYDSYRADGGLEDPGLWRLAPEQPARTETFSALEEGASIFSAGCAVCHKIQGRMVGSGLAGIAERRDWDWLVRLTQNFPQMVAGGDPLAICLWEEGNKAAMSDFNHLTEEQVANIYFYIENERRRRGIPKSPAKRCDSNAASELAVLREETRVRDSAWRANLPQNLPALTGGTRLFQQEAYYQPFSVFPGWSNCDRFRNTDRSSSIQTLFVESEEPAPMTQVFLVYPNRVIIDFKRINLHANRLEWELTEESMILPEAEEVLLITISSNKSENIEVYVGTHQLDNNNTWTIKPEKMEEKRLKAYLSHQIREFAAS